MKRFLIVVMLVGFSSAVAEELTYKKDTPIFFRDKSRHRFPYKDEHPRTFLLSYRGSGSHYFMYLVQYFSRRIWQSAHKRYFFHLPRLDKSLPPYYRGHECNKSYIFNENTGYFFSYDPMKDKLLLLVRNYKESCISKKNRSRGYKEGLTTSSFQPACTLFYKNLKCFDEWDPEKRLLVRYEDLILKPEETMREVVQFLELPVEEEEIAEFFEPENFQFHFERSLDLVKIINYSSNVSRGSSITYHSDQTDPQLLEAVDRIFENFSPKLYKRYLRGYKQ